MMYVGHLRYAIDELQKYVVENSKELSYSDLQKIEKLVKDAKDILGGIMAKNKNELSASKNSVS